MVTPIDAKCPLHDKIQIIFNQLKQLHMRGVSRMHVRERSAPAHLISIVQYAKSRRSSLCCTPHWILGCIIYSYMVRRSVL